MKDSQTVPWVTHPWVAEGQNTVRFGVFLLGPGAGWSVYRDSIQMAEALGFDSYWTYDHPLSTADCWTTLAALAVTTKTIRLGSIVSCISYRSPAMLARVAADVDRWSNGRVILGVGIGNAPEEFAELGIPFPSPHERQQVLNEAIQVVLGMWGESPFTFQGQHFQVQEALLWPGPVQQPHVPIMIAGGGERITLHQVAQYADVSNFGAHEVAGSAFGLDDVRRKFAALRSHCDAIGRPYESVLRSYLSGPVVLAQTQQALRAKLDAVPEDARSYFQSCLISGTPDEVVAHYQSLIDAGIQYLVMAMWGPDLETMQILAQEVIPALTQAKKA
jgi:alkanesulfonate monooxygenase SsuD/methylene tetrahydromethanopterin reductase-like flavin-dependent oxidoreductase (luciferase family)